MAKLYWRIKKNGKWTWTPVTVLEEYDRFTLQYDDVLVIENFNEAVE